MDELPGRTLSGRYRIERRLGEGGTGIVWLARDMRERGHVWALKEIDFSGVASSVERAEVMAMFEREADILMTLSHPALPRIVDRFSEGGHEFLVMERVEGPTLDGALVSRRGPLTEPEVIRWSMQICDVLAYLHQQTPPVVYRDLKPANVMLTLEGRIKLIDFGIARPLNPARQRDTAAYGTPGYAPPEQYGGAASPASDVYALGVTMHQLLTRRNPQEDGFAMQSTRRFNPSVSVGCEALIEACTQSAAPPRPSVDAVRKTLEGLLAACAKRESGLLERVKRLLWG
ncbi:MAG: serine/threonine protein kinase [Proteobacteria bacterium]|nr:serine/threonine protein kinase [Pseudomonadota bacterium]